MPVIMARQLPRFSRSLRANTSLDRPAKTQHVDAAGSRRQLLQQNGASTSTKK